MQHILLMVPIGLGVGLLTVSRGLIRALENQGLKTCFLNLVSHSNEEEVQISEEEALSSVESPLPIGCVESLLSKGEEQRIFEFFVAYFHIHSKEADIVVIQGVISTQLRDYASKLNFGISQALDAEVIFVTTPNQVSLQKINDQIEIAAQIYKSISNPKILGCMFNKVGAPLDRYGNARIDLFDAEKKLENTGKTLSSCPVFREKHLKLLAIFPWQRQLMAQRPWDIQKFLGATVLSEGKMRENRVMHLAIAAATVENMAHILKPDTMIFTSGDRSDVVVAICLAFINGVNIAALVLTGGHLPGPNTMELCQRAIELGLPIFSTQTDSLRTSISLQNLSMEIPKDDFERQEIVEASMASFIDKSWIKELSFTIPTRRLSPAAFRFQLIEKAKQANRKIVLPEGNEPRILKAASICASRKIAQIVLLGNREQLNRLAKEYQIPIGEGVEIIDPDEVRETYVAPLVQLRKHKGVTEKNAREYLDDIITLGTMMLHLGEVEGLVAGATHTTARTILPSLKLIKTKPSSKLVSSVFFMCLPTQVLVYGDCAVNQNPSVEELADIAIQSAHSAQKFGVSPRIAMISYSTGESGIGADVVKVREATRLVKEICPELIVDGPIQFDAAFSPDVAKKKAPNSPVAGKATVYIFPDLNTGNATYKAVQRTAKALSIGPMLQGLRKPVNDLSRGATVDDIVFTIAMTAIQAEE